MSTVKKGYKFTVQGRYYAENEHGAQTLKFYKKLEFVFPEVVTYTCGKKWEKYFEKGKDAENNVEKKRAVPNVKRQNILKCFKYMIKNYYLHERLREEYSDYIKFQTFQITKRVEIELDEDKLKEFKLTGDVDDMSESQLLQFIAIKGLEVDLSPYFDLADKKIAVQMVMEDESRDRPGITRPLTEAEKDLLPPADVFLSRPSSTASDDIPTNDEDELDGFV